MAISWHFNQETCGFPWHFTKKNGEVMEFYQEKWGLNGFSWEFNGISWDGIGFNDFMGISHGFSWELNG
jgi:hypothetical protein